MVPKSISLMGNTGQSDPVTRYIALRSRSNKPFEITEIDLPPGVTVTTKTSFGKAGWRCELSIVLPLADVEDARITLYTNQDKAQPVHIPIRVVAAPNAKATAPTP